MSAVSVTVSSPLGEVSLTQDCPDRYGAGVSGHQQTIQELLTIASTRVLNSYDFTPHPTQKDDAFDGPDLP
jgi:hypothetical protein